MSEQPATDVPDEDADATAFAAGRYLYCAVETSGAGGDADAAVSTSGIEGGDPYLIEHGGIGVVVQTCDSPYDSTEPDTLRQWLLRHQAVIDEAGDAFGSPLPFRFDTIIRGDDGQVREWLDAESGAIEDALETLSGAWEYRIEVVWDRDELDTRLASEDDRLAELEAEREGADEGRGFLLEKQYDQRLRECRADRLDAAMATLVRNLEHVAREVEPADRSSSLLTSDGSGETDDSRTVSVLAPGDRETELGDRLESFAADRPVEIRFTGPWPAYSFAPALGDDA